MKHSIPARIRAFLFRPRQVIITDSHSPGPASKLHVRPFSFFLFVALACAGLVMLGMYLSLGDPANNQQAQITRLQHEQGRLKDTVAEKEALMSLKEQQVESLNAEITGLRQQQSSLQEKLDMYDNILNARKDQGVHLLQVAAQRQPDHSIAYSFVLVKGGNYPRTASGNITFSTLNPANEPVTIPLATGEAALPYSTRSHTFMQGDLPWNQSWRPKKLRMTLFDQRGKEMSQSEVNISD